jgi:CheY-like chemotaxis protein
MEKIILKVINEVGLHARPAADFVRTAGQFKSKIEARNLAIGEESGLPLSPGRYILLGFRDYGVGIPREHLSRVFDPYFTTKQMGSGLGLATSWSIIKRHDGHIRVESEPGIGTVFHIYLPATGTAEAPPPEEREALLTGQGRVLVMDDDDGIRKTAAMLLEALGYTSETVEDGAAAIEVFQSALEEGNPFDAVIMDLTIPDGVGGMEALAGLRVLEPVVRAIVSSGYSNDPIMSEYARHGFHGVLVKPYRAEDIGHALSGGLTGLEFREYVGKVSDGLEHHVAYIYKEVQLSHSQQAAQNVVPALYNEEARNNTDDD